MPVLFTVHFLLGLEKFHWSCLFASITYGWQQTRGASWSSSLETLLSTSSSALSSSSVWLMKFLRSLLTSRRSSFLKITCLSLEGWHVRLHSLADCSSYPPFKINQDPSFLKPYKQTLWAYFASA